MLDVAAKSIFTKREIEILKLSYTAMKSSFTNTAAFISYAKMNVFI
jgi:hypothetical protein